MNTKTTNLSPILGTIKVTKEDNKILLYARNVYTSLNISEAIDLSNKLINAVGSKIESREDRIVNSTSIKSANIPNMIGNGIKKITK